MAKKKKGNKADKKDNTAFPQEDAVGRNSGAKRQINNKK